MTSGSVFTQNQTRNSVVQPHQLATVTFGMAVIIAGIDPVGTDLVAASLMGFEPREVPSFARDRKVPTGTAGRFQQRRSPSPR